MSVADGLDCVRHWSGRLLVVGDVILDRHTWGDASRVSPEAPVVVLEADLDEVRPGGAAAVAAMLAAWGKEVELYGGVGEDSSADVLRRLLLECGVNASGVVAASDRPTTQKERFVGRAGNRHAHQMLRVDRERRAPLPADLEQRICHEIRSAVGRCSAILVSDYGKGVCTPELLACCVSAANEAGVPLLVDPARGVDLGRYRGADIIKPNRREAELATGVVVATPADALRAGAMILDSIGGGAAVITLDADGLVIVAGGEGRHHRTRVREVHDVTGAGDAAFAMLGLGMATGLTLDDLGPLVNVAAGAQVERWGVATPSLDELVPAPEMRRRLRAAGKVVSLVEAAKRRESFRAEGLRVVLTNGCFDLLHFGHHRMLEEAAAQGDALIVAVNSDRSVRELKGPARPVVPEAQRAEMLAGLACVDLVVVFDEPTPHCLLRTLHPDVLVKGGSTDEIVGRELVEAVGGEVRRLSLIEGWSTTGVISKASSLHRERAT